MNIDINHIFLACLRNQSAVGTLFNYHTFS